MANPNFSSVLDAPASSIERPPAVPAGTYVWVIKGLPKRDKNQKGTEFISFPVKAIQARDDVDQEELESFGGLGKVESEFRFYVTDKSGWRLKEFLEDTLNLDPAKGSMWELAQATNGEQFLGAVTHTATQDGKGVQWQITSTAAVD